MRCEYCTKIIKEGEKCCDLEEIKTHIKTHCVICKAPLTGELKDFLIRGNWCPWCSGQARHRIIR
jgi:hypothetical protein